MFRPFDKSVSKEQVEQDLAASLTQMGLRIVGRDFKRPWGGFFVISDDQITKFLTAFFPDIPITEEGVHLQLSPKILVVEPHLRLSWQYHDRRAEVHRVISGPVAYTLSPTDEQSSPRTYQEGAIVRINQGFRHRLIGLDNWGVVAEIWQHTDPSHPSEETDNHRLQDDFQRT